MLPYVFGFRLVPRKEVLEDGTVVTLVSSQHDTLTSIIYSVFSQFSRENVE